VSEPNQAAPLATETLSHDSSTGVDAETPPPAEQGHEGRESSMNDEKDAALLEQEGDIAADYLEGLLDIADLDGDLDMDVEGSRASVSIVGPSLEVLVGPEGDTLEALQGLTRLAVTRQTGARSRLMLDVAGYRADRRNELAETARRTVQQVSERHEAISLPAMTSFERKVVHDAVAVFSGVRTESEGDEPHRFVVIRPS
jgi:spoIIIJ-associated protein